MKLHVGQGIEVVDAGVGTERPGRFVFEAAGGVAVLRLVDDGEVVLVDLRDAAAGDRAAEARLVGEKVLLAVALARRRHGFGRNVVGAFELHFAVVAGRHGARFVDDVHQHLRAVGRQTLAGNGVGLQHLLAFRGGLEEGLAVLDLDAARAAHGDGLDVLRTHDGADARASGGAMQIVDDGRVEAALLARDADAGDMHHRVLMLFLDPLVRVPDAGAPDRRRIVDLALVILDQDVDGLRRLALDDHHVPAGELQSRRRNSRPSWSRRWRWSAAPW